MKRIRCSRRIRAFVVALACLFPSPVAAHPGTGIVIDRFGQIYFVDMVSGEWKVDVHGVLTHIQGPGFHWMTLDASDRFGNVQLPSGFSGDIARIGTGPALMLGSDFPLALAPDGNVYFPAHRGGGPLQVWRLLPTGVVSVLASIPATNGRAPVRHLNGLAAGPDGSLYYTEDDALRRISRAGQVTTVIERIDVPGCTAPPAGGTRRDPLLRGLAVDGSGTIYVAATGCGGVLRVSATGGVSLMPQVAQPWQATGIALLGNDLYVLEFQNAATDDRREMVPRIRKIASDGRTSVIATVVRR